MNKRFDRHALIPDWQQNLLHHATVIIVGMGALGNEVSRILAMSGVGKLILCDPDHIETSNLSRTVLFRTSDIGRLKVDAASDSLSVLYPQIIIEKRARPLIHGIGLAELKDSNLILSCLDTRSARLQLAGRCQLVRAPYIDGGTHPWVVKFDLILIQRDHVMHAV
jgi:molybdopterin/thiamine biosynthesis adenylyltransferase